MNFIDIIFIIITLIGVYVGYNGGYLKILSDTIIFFVVSLISSVLTGLLFDKVIAYLPFMNLWGASEGIKTINIVMWRVALYIILIILLLLIIDRVLKKTGIQERIDEKIITMRKWGRYLGCLFVVPFMAVLIFNVILFLGLPIFNISSIHESKTADFLMNNMILLAGQNKDLYESEKYIIEQINNDNTVDTYSGINDDIASYLVENKLISQENIDKLKSDKKLTGTKTKKVENNSNKNNNSNNSNNNSNNSSSSDDYNDDSSDNNDYSDDSYDDSGDTSDSSDSGDDDYSDDSESYDDDSQSTDDDEYYFDDSAEVL